MVIVAAAALCIHQLLATYIIIFDDVPTASEARAGNIRVSYPIQKEPFGDICSADNQPLACLTS